MFENALNVNHMIYFRVTQVADQLAVWVQTVHSVQLCFRGTRAGFDMFKQPLYSINN